MPTEKPKQVERQYMSKLGEHMNKFIERMRLPQHSITDGIREHFSNSSADPANTLLDITCIQLENGFVL